MPAENSQFESVSHSDVVTIKDVHIYKTEMILLNISYI